MKLIPNGNLFNPNVCLICEEQPDGAEVIDTEQQMPVNHVYPLNGRKYVCFRCAAEFAKLIGFTSVDLNAKIQVELDRANYVLANVKQRTRELAEHLVGFVDEAAPQSAVEAVKAEVTPAKAALEADIAKRGPGRPKKEADSGPSGA